MIGTSRSEYVLIRTSIFLLRAVVPLCIILCLISFVVRSIPILNALLVYAIVEIVFYVLVLLYWAVYLQRPAKYSPISSRQKRQALFARCMKAIPDPENYLTGWFKGADLREIKRENLNDFWRWSFFNVRETDVEHDEEINGYTNKFEELLKEKLEPGKGNADCIRLTLDDVDYRHRPLVWYLIVALVDLYTHVSMLFHGFQYFRTPLTVYPTILPSRPQTILTRYKSPSKRISYWFRPHKSTSKLPILFVHGIGIGLMPYVPFLGQLNSTDREIDSDIGIIAVEILSLSFRMTSPMIDREDICRQLQTILAHHNFDKFVLVTHSCGSMIATHLLKYPPILQQISSLVFIDPISLLLHLPHIAYNFSYRSPKGANEWQLWYFASKDIGVAHTLHRTFFWADICIFPEDLDHIKTSIFLSGRDLIVDTHTLWRYLTGDSVVDEELVETKVMERKFDRVRVVSHPDLDHAQIFDVKESRDRLIRAVREHSENTLPDFRDGALVD